MADTNFPNIPGKPINQSGVATGFPKFNPPPRGEATSSELGNTIRQSFDEIVAGLRPTPEQGVGPIPASSIDVTGKYKYVFPYDDHEETHALQQTTADKWGNGLAKFGGITLSTFLSGTVGMIHGTAKMISTGKMSDLFDNPTTQYLDEFNKDLEKWLPNYYTHAEQDASWYSPKNILTANFWSDKVLKNLGFTAGTVASMYLGGALLKSVGLVNKLVRAGEGLNTLLKTEKIIETVPRAGRFGAINNMLASSSSKVRDVFSQSLTSADRNIMAVMGSMGEAAIEALQNMNEYRERLIDSYIDRYGQAPTGTDLQEINQYADAVGNHTWGMNVALLSATNRLQFNKIMGSSKTAERRGLFEITKQKAAKEATFAEKMGAEMVKAPSILEKGLGKTGKWVDKYLWKPAKLTFAPIEAFEEFSQFAIQKGTNGYFRKGYDLNRDVTDFWSSLSGSFENVLGEGVHETLNSKEGLESMLIGGISGGIQTSLSPLGNTSIKERGLFGTGGYRQRNTDIALKELNNSQKLNDTLKDQIKYVNIGINSQRARARAIEANDTLSEKDYETDYMLSYILPRVKYGKLSLIKEEVDTYRRQAMTEEGFQELKDEGVVLTDETREHFLARASSIEAVAEQVNNAYERVYDTYSQKFTNDKKRQYSDQVIEKMTYDLAKISDHDKRLVDLTNKLALSGITTTEILEGVLTNSEPNELATKEALDKINKMPITSDEKNIIKRDLIDTIELSLRRKFYLDEYEDIKKNPENYTDNFSGYVAEGLPIEVNQPIPDTRKVSKRKIEVGQEYSLDDILRREKNSLIMSPKITVLSQTLGGELEVLLPNGDITFLKPSQFNKYKIAEEGVDNTSEKLDEVLDKTIDDVLALPEFSHIEAAPARDKIDYINSLNNKKLIDAVEKEFHSRVDEVIKQAEKEKKDKEEIKKSEEKIEKQQDQIEKESGIVSIVPPEERDHIVESKLKHYTVLFTSTTSESEGSDNIDWQKDPNSSKPHIKNARIFLNNAKNFPNRAKLRSILVTPHQVNALGLEGIVQMSYGYQEGEKEVETITDVTDVDKGWVAAVFVEQDGKNLYYVNVKGERIGKVFSKVNVKDVIFQTMPTTSLNYSNNNPRYRQGEEQDARDYSNAWRIKRAELFAAPSDMVQPYQFNISRGIPNEIVTTSEGKNIYERNHVSDVLVSEQVITTQEDLIRVSREGVVFHDAAAGEGINITFKKGLTVLKYQDTLQVLSNTRIGEKKAKSLYMVIKALAEELQNTKSLNMAYARYLQNILYWRKTADNNKNQIYVKAATAEIFIGGKSYSITDIINKETEIINVLKEAYHNVNMYRLEKTFHEPFYEYTDDIANPHKWVNYQTYLLSKYEADGKTARYPDQTPLVTSVAKPSDLLPYSYKQKYAALVDMDLPVVKSAPTPSSKPSPKPAPSKGKAVEIDGYIMDGTIYYKKYPKGEIGFSGETNENGDFQITVKADEITKEYASDDTAFNTIVNALKSIPEFANDINKTLEILSNQIGKDALETKENIIQLFFSMRIKAELLASQESKTKEQGVEEPIEEKPLNPDTYKGPDPSLPDYSRVGREDVSMLRISDAELTFFKEWAKINVPNLPYEILERLITTYDNEEAWGAFENGVIKFYRGAISGTEFHEVFEGIWKSFLNMDEQAAILEQERNSVKSFVDRQTKKTILTSEATDSQLKEKIADDFGKFMKGNIPVKTLGEKLVKFFRDILDFFRDLFSKPSLKKELFKSINQGKFKNEVIPERVLSETPEYSRIPGITEKQANDIVGDMFIRTAIIVYGEEKQDLFNFERLTSDGVFGAIKEQYRDQGIYQDLGERRWELLVKRTKEKLRIIGINFNQDDIVTINDDGINNRDYAPEPFSTDWKKTSSFAIKILIATLPKTQATNQQRKTALTLPKRAETALKGFITVDFSRMFSTLMHELSNTTNVKEIEKKMIKLLKADSDYVRLFTRLGGDLTNEVFDFSKFGEDEWRLFINFYQTFSKQKPEAFVQYFNAGDAYIGGANLYKPVEQAKRRWIEELKILARNPRSAISYNGLTKTYNFSKTDLYPNAIPKTSAEAVQFLTSIGINFTNEMFVKLSTESKSGRKSEQRKFFESTAAIYTYLKEAKELINLNTRTLGISGPFSILAELAEKITNPTRENTHINLEGNQMQDFTENNYSSIFENEFNRAETVDELKENRPELNDLFSNNSIVLKKGGVFYDTIGKRIREIKVQTIEGVFDELQEKGILIRKLSKGDRFAVEINQNLVGNYYILIPADASTQWMINLGNPVSYDEISSANKWNSVYDIFRGYLIDDITLALDSDNRISQNIPSEIAKELRFFNDILAGSKEFNDITSMIENGATLSEILGYVDEHNAVINEYIVSYLTNSREQLKDKLRETNQLFYKLVENEGYYSFPSLLNDFATTNQINKSKISQEQLDNILLFLTVNYNINNVEFHKILFGDPYQFKLDGKKMEEVKRIKSFLSPRRTTFDSPEFNSWANRHYNTVEGTSLQENELGHHLFKPYMKTVALEEVILTTNLFPKVKEADSMSWLLDNAYREVKIKNGQWTKEAEKWHQWQMAYTRQNLPGYTYKSAALKAQDIELMKRPEPKHTIEVLKPIVTGSVHGENIIRLNLDKTSQMPIYYSMVKGRSLESLYLKMIENGIDYVIMNTGRKVGVKKPNPIYNKNGTLNTGPFEDVVEVPWGIYGIQVETTYDHDKLQPRGSQLTKIASLDLFNMGEAVGLTKERKEAVTNAYLDNVNALNIYHTTAYNRLLKKLGIEDRGGSFELTNPKAIQDSLEYEMLRRGMSENDKETIQLDENGEFRIPFEASTSYKQIKDILYSMVHKSINSPRMNGGAKVQVPVTMWENAAEGRSLIIKENNKWRKITREEYDTLSPKRQADVRLTSDTLKFYTKEDPYCEVLVPHWFKNMFSRKKFPTDQSILDYLNTDEGKRILTGVGFRIPTQAMASVEIFRVKGFLPQYMGDTVVVPSEITAKTDSDFDIDKMNMYLKSVYTDEKGNVRLINYLGDDTKPFFDKLYNDVIYNKIAKIEKFSEFRETLVKVFKGIESLEEFDRDELEKVLSSDQIEFFDYHVSLLQEIINQAAEKGINPSQYIQDQINEMGEYKDNLTLKLFNTKIREEFIDNHYMKAVENNYYETLETLLTLPENFDRLVTPVSNAGLKVLAGKLQELRGQDESLIPNRILNRVFMGEQRHAFISAKKWVGIAASNITAHALSQKGKIYIDPSRFNKLSKFERTLLGDGTLSIPHNSIDIDGDSFITISGMMTADGKNYISDRLSGYATSFVDVANDPYIMNIIASDNAVGIFLFLERIGAGETGVMFMNQPIIQEYLTYLSNNNINGLFGSRNIAYIKKKFSGPEVEVRPFTVDKFEENIVNYATDELTVEEKGEQLAIFDEFIKIAKMSEQNFKLTQAFNYDTTKFRSGDTFSRKQTRTDIARETNIFSSVDEILDNSHIGEQVNTLSSVMEAMGAVLKLEQPMLRSITDGIIESFEKHDFISGDDFDAIVSKLKGSFLDYIIQIRLRINTRIAELLKVPATSVVTQFNDAKSRHPELNIFTILSIDTSARGSEENTTKTLRLDFPSKEPYDLNRYRDMMYELKDVEPELYNNIILLSLFQGTNISPSSLRRIIPVEDFSAKIKDVISTLSATPEIQAFAKGWFQRNNWKDSRIVPVYKPKFFYPSENGIVLDQPFEFTQGGEERYQYVSPVFQGSGSLLSKMGRTPAIYHLALINPIYDSNVIKYDFIKIPRVVYDDRMKDRIDIVTGTTVTSQMLAIAIKKGSSIYREVYGYQKVKYANGEPVVTGKGQHVYKLVNLYGDGLYGSEYYDEFVPSQLDNGTKKIEFEISDRDIIAAIGNPNDSETYGERIVVQTGEGASVTGEEAIVVSSRINGDESSVPDTEIGEQPTVKIKSTPNTGIRTTVLNFISLKDVKVTAPNQINVLRRYDTNQHYGNPFTGTDKGAGTIRMKDNKEATAAYKEWLTNPDASFTDKTGKVHTKVNPQQREWILKQINSGALDNKVLLYYKPGNYYSHADALRDIVNSRTIETPITNETVETETEEMKVEEPLPTEEPYVNPSEAPIIAPKLQEFYDSLAPDQRIEIGSWEEVLFGYDNIPFMYSEEEYIEQLKCKL